MEMLCDIVEKWQERTTINFRFAGVSIPREGIQSVNDQNNNRIQTNMKK